ncbi:MAG: hypothetical protein QM541_07380 [Flavobacterium sp.]|nr:hypothetical protein [Flavobacterium sp.]
MNAEQFDKHLFNLSQQASDDGLMPFNEAAWQQMEQLLDGEKKKRKFVLWWLLLPLLLVGGGTAMYLHHNNASNTTIPSDNLKAKTEESKTNNQTPKPKIKAAAQVGLNEANTLNTPIAKANDNKKLLVKQTIPKVTKGTSTNTGVNATVQEQATAKLASSSYNKRNKQIAKSAKQIALTKTIAQDAQLNTPQSSSTNKAPVVDNTTSSKIDDVVAKTEPAEIVNTTDKKEAKINIDTAAKLVVVIKNDNLKKKPSFLSKFEVSAFVAADISAVDLALKEPKSIAFGIGLSYQITKKLSIATGFGVSRKLYSADSADYTNRRIWATASYKLKTVDANCLVYELPINLQYQFAQSKKDSWFAVGGLSTYFMKSESYDYNYLWNNMPRKTNYLIEDKNNHLFSILNLAVGYRRQLGKKLSYQLTPFVKIPLTGIGEGEVKLYSLGLQLSLNIKGK